MRLTSIILVTVLALAGQGARPLANARPVIEVSG